MKPITPETIAALASKLYNQQPAGQSMLAGKEMAKQPNTGEPTWQPAVHSITTRTSDSHTQHQQSHSRIHEAPKADEGDAGLARIQQALYKAANPTTNSEKRLSIDGNGPHDQQDQSLSKVSANVGGEGLQRFVNDVRAGYRQPQRPIRFSDLERIQRPQFGYEQAIDKLSNQSGGPRAYDVEAIRRDFPILRQQVHGHPLIWFDNAATTQKPQVVIDAVSNFYACDNSNIHRAAHSLAARSTDAFEAARRKVQKFIGAGSPEEIVWVRGTTEGINLVAQTFGHAFLQPNDEIILSTLEHHANIVPWQLVARQTGARLRVIPVNDAGEVMLTEYQALLGPRTKIVAITQASNSLGTILPVAEMTRAAHRFGARVLIDGAQSIAHFPINVRDIGCDFFVFSGHKIFAPMGVGAVYIREELLESLPPWQGGGNMIRNVTFEETTFAPPPARFEAGTPTVADAVGLGAALDYVSQFGMDNVARHEHELLTYATERLSRINGVRLIGHAREKVSVISMVLHGRSTEEVGKALDQHGIAVRAGHHCAQPSLRRFGVESTVRPSFSIYNTREEVDRLEEAIRRILHR